MKDLPVLLDRLETAGGPADPVPSADARIRPAPAAPSPVTARAPVIFWLIVLAIIPFMVLNYNGVLYSYYVGRELRRPGRTYLYASAISIGVLVVLWVGVWALLNLHCPPYASGLDDAPELNAALKPVIRGGRPSIIPVGSHAVRDAIKRYQPVVGLHGPIHESRGAQKIGRTLCVNPGSDYSSGVLRGAVIDLAQDGSCLDFLLTTG